MGAETSAQNDVLCAFGWLPLYRRNVGMAAYQGRKVRFGKPGMADLWGILPDGRHLEVEMKSPKGRQSEAQKNWQAAVERSGGIYIVARSEEDVWKGLANAGYVRTGTQRIETEAELDAMEG